MRALKFLVVFMGVLIVAGAATLGVVIAGRLGEPATPRGPVTVAQPPGTRLVAVVPQGEFLALHLSGGGPDRVVLVDPRRGRSGGEVRVVVD